MASAGFFLARELNESGAGARGDEDYIILLII